MFQKTKLADATAVGTPGDLPEEIATWGSDLDLLSDLTGKAPAEFGFDGFGFWPVAVTAATVDPLKQAVTDGLERLTIDVPNRRWTAETAVRDLTADEITAALGAARDARRMAVDARRDTMLVSGFSHDFGAPNGVKVLQTREGDETNWLTLQNSCIAAVMAGQGATVGAVIRTADNVNIPLSYADGLQVMLAMAAWGAAVYAASWKLKDAIAAATDQAALDAIDITIGWPANP